MIVHSDRNLDLNWMLTHLETMKMTGSKMSDSLFDDVYGLVKECKRQESKNKKNKRNEMSQNLTDYAISEVSEVDIHAKVHRIDDADDMKNMKICINDIQNPNIEMIENKYFPCPPPGNENSNKIILTMNNANMKIYYD